MTAPTMTMMMLIASLDKQDKQPVPPQQDISPTAPTANNNTSPSLIESPTDKSTDPMNTDNWWRWHDHSQQSILNDDATSFATDSDNEYGKYDYNDDDDDDDDDDSYASFSSSEEDHYDSYNPNLIIDMYGNAFKIDKDDVISYVDGDDDTSITIQAAQR